MKTKYDLNYEPTSAEEFKEFGDALIDYALKDDTLNIDGFALSLRIAPNHLKSLITRDKYFADAYGFALATIALRIKNLVLQGKIESKAAFDLLPFLDSEYRDWKIRLAEKQGAQENKLIVEIEQFPSTGKVPKKPEALHEN